MQDQTVQTKGKTVDEAVQAALSALNCTIEDVTVTVIEEPNKGVLGIFGSKPATVEVCRNEKPVEIAERVVKEILAQLGIVYTIESITPGENSVRINFTGQDMGLLIGRKGETLDALQFLTGLIVNRKLEEKFHVILDVEGYRLKREESLRETALKLSEKVQRTHKNVVMRPMSAQERRIVHTTLQDVNNITTYSTGSDPNRRVVITYKRYNMDEEN